MRHQENKNRDASQQAGFTLLETVIALGILALVIVPISAVVNQFILVPAQRAETLMLVHEARQSVRWIAEDARQAESFTLGTDPDYGTFTWLDRLSSGTVASHAVRYYHSSGDAALFREETIDTVSTTTRIYGNVLDYSDISVTASGDVVSTSVATSIVTYKGTETRTASLHAQMRPIIPAPPQPTPASFTLAWDDYESDTTAGGSGWTAPWTFTDNAVIESSGTPYEGLLHLRLRASNGYAVRILDLTGQASVRARFWAKAASFEPGETAALLISTDGSSFTIVRTWVDGEDDDTYRFEDIDLSSFAMSATFYIAFDADMSNTQDLFYVDDFKIVVD